MNLGMENILKFDERFQGYTLYKILWWRRGGAGRKKGENCIKNRVKCLTIASHFSHCGVDINKNKFAGTPVFVETRLI